MTQLGRAAPASQFGVYLRGIDAEDATTRLWVAEICNGSLAVSVADPGSQREVDVVLQVAEHERQKLLDHKLDKGVVEED
jgi:DNA-binding beta-propeller fold protein YncE